MRRVRKDDDNDGISNDADQCPNTPVGSAVDAVGCAESEKDDDNDGVSNDADQCPNTPVGSAVDALGCAESEKDDDSDGVSNDADQCPNTPVGATVDANGCAESQKDDDNDGVSNDADQCPNTPAGAAVDANGCAESQKDDDGDGVTNDSDQCPDTEAGVEVDSTGCPDASASVEQVYEDSIDALIGRRLYILWLPRKIGRTRWLVLRNNATTSNYTSLVNYINNRGGTRLLNKIGGISHGEDSGIARVLLSMPRLKRGFARWKRYLRSRDSVLRAFQSTEPTRSHDLSALATTMIMDVFINPRQVSRLL